ncbi:MAG TPA: hypothetical protein VM261_21565 [Kofleriaceae bacterium]|nr:hypothetical protein [Kofleriaceae bacterium]
MSQVVARDSVCADHLVYPWPYQVGAQVELACGQDEVAVMCPAWAVAANLGPGRHTWQSPDPSKPTAIYFVLTGPVEVEFDMMTQFPMPGSGQLVMLRAQGSVLVRVADPALLIAQFVGLPFVRVNEGLMRSVSSSVERMLGKLLPRKVALAGTPAAVADPSTWPPLVEELMQYNPTVGAVHGVAFVRFKQLQINSGDQSGWHPTPSAAASSSASSPAITPPSSGLQARTPQQGAAISGELGGSSNDSTEKGAAPSNPALVPPPMLAAPALPAGTRVLVALADGLFHSAVVRQALQGYYELDVGDSGETVWVPMGQVAPQV